MRTQDEIVKRIEAVIKEDWIGFQTSCLIRHLDFAHAMPYLKPKVTEDQSQIEKQTPSEIIKHYMPFAWEKANSCRGISASRSVEHMVAWLWLDGKDELLPKMESEYEFYGKPCLVLVCQEYGIDWRKLDDGFWRNDEGSESILPDRALALHGIKDSGRTK